MTQDPDHKTVTHKTVTHKTVTHKTVTTGRGGGEGGQVRPVLSSESRRAW